MSGAASADLANRSAASPPFAPPPRASASSAPSASPSSSPSSGSDRHQNLKHQQQFKTSFRTAIQLIEPPKERRENADIRREGETNTQREAQQEERTREKMIGSVAAGAPCSSASSSPLCAPMDPLSQLMASFAAAHHNQQQRGASLPPGPAAAPPPPRPPPVSAFLPNGAHAQFAPVGPFLSSAHPPPPDLNALLAIAPPGVLGPFFAGGVANGPFVPPPPEMLFAVAQQPHNQSQPSNGTVNANNGTASNGGTNGMPSGIPPGPFPFQLDPAILANFQPYMVPPEARRKNATREVTAPLKHWLNSHRKNPYPTKAEKTFLAVITHMTMTQVSTWFANARRRLKKENKMTWSPRNRPNDEDDFLEMDEVAEATTAQNATANGAEGPSSPELEEEEEEEEGEGEGAANGTRDTGQRQRPRRAIWSIADTLAEGAQWEEQHNAKQKEELNEHDESKDTSGTKCQHNYEGGSDSERTEAKRETNTEQASVGHKCEHDQHGLQQRSEAPRGALGDQFGANALPPRSPHSLVHTAHPPLDFLIGSPAVPSVHPMLLPFPPNDFPNARQNLLFALQHQNQLHHQRSLLTAANPMIAAMFLAQQFASQHQQIGGMAGEDKQRDEAVAAQTATEHHQREKGEGPEEKRQQQRERNDGASLLPLPSQPPPFVHLHHHHFSSSVSPTSSVLVGQKRSAAQVTAESADNGIPLSKRQCRAET